MRQTCHAQFETFLPFPGNGLLFIGCWPAYSGSVYARYISASVPLLASMHFALVGSGCMRDPLLVKSATVSCLPPAWQLHDSPNERPRY